MAATTVRDLGAQLAAWKQQSDINASAELNPDAPRNPFPNQDEFLAAEVKKIGDASAERLRLTSEQAREEYDAQVRTNILKEKNLAEDVQQRRDLATAQTQTKNQQEFQAIMAQLDSVQVPIGQTMHTMDKGQLARLSNLIDNYESLRRRAPELDLPEYDTTWLHTGYPIVPQEIAVDPKNQKYLPTFEDGHYSQFQQNEDGSIQVKVATGEIFKARNPEDLAEQLSKAKVHASRWAREQRELARQAQSAPAQFEQPQPEQSNPEYSSIADAWAAQQSDALARQWGFSDNSELLQFGQQLRETQQTLEEYRTHNLALDFQLAHPEFPGTPQASESLANIVEQQGWEFTPDNLSAAHLLAMRQGLYQPLTADQIALANGTAQPTRSRASVPPTVRSGSPDVSFAQSNPWNTPLADLRNMAIRQQLGEKGP